MIAGVTLSCSLFCDIFSDIKPCSEAACTSENHSTETNFHPSGNEFTI